MLEFSELTPEVVEKYLVMSKNMLKEIDHTDPEHVIGIVASSIYKMQSDAFLIGRKQALDMVKKFVEEQC